MRLADQLLQSEKTVPEPPSAEAEHSELRELVRRALSTLAPQQAEAFWLRHLEQLDVDEVAWKWQSSQDTSACWSIGRPLPSAQFSDQPTVRCRFQRNEHE